MTNFNVEIVEESKPKKVEVGQVRMNDTGEVILIGKNSTNDLMYMILNGDDMFNVHMLAVNENIIRYGYPNVAENINIKINE